jgi:hypothetical protein
VVDPIEAKEYGGLFVFDPIDWNGQRLETHFEHKYKNQTKFPNCFSRHPYFFYFPQIYIDKFFDILEKISDDYRPDLTHLMYENNTEETCRIAKDHILFFQKGLMCKGALSFENELRRRLGIYGLNETVMTLTLCEH